MSEVHVVRQGECLAIIARHYGFKDWQVLYDHPANSELKKRRHNPHELSPGDLVAIPERKPFEVERPTGSWHDLAIAAETPRIKIRLVDIDDSALAGQAYQLTIDGVERQGTTDGDGVVDEPFGYGSQTAILKTTILRDGTPHELEYVLDIGSLDPVTQTSGLQGRLRNLQYYHGPIDGNFGPQTRDALMAFQRSVGLDPTGERSDATLKELEKQHDENA